MAIRMTGLISGMDTESIVSQLMDAQKLKNKRTTDKQTMLTWKQDKWKELNAKLYKLYKEDLYKVKTQGNYSAKSVTASNENLVTVTGNANAPEGAHNITIDKLASSQYVTSANITTDSAGNLIKDINGKAITASTKLVDIKTSTTAADAIAPKTLINFTTGGVTTTLEVTANTTIADFVDKAKAAGLNANFDATQGRLFISSKQSGEENSFEITATTSTATDSKNEILNAIGYSTLSSANKTKADNALKTLSNSISVDTDIAAATKTLTDLAKDEALKQIMLGVDAEIRLEVTSDARLAEENAIKTEVMKEQIVLLQEEARKSGATEEEIAAIKEETLTAEQKANIETLQAEKITSSESRIKAAVEVKVAEAITAEKAKETNRYLDATSSVAGQTAITNAATAVEDKAAVFIEKSKEAQVDVSNQLAILGLGALSTDIAASDSQITYNNVVITGTSNVISVNGLSLTLKGLSNSEAITLNVSNNNQNTYDMVKNFLKSYNEILKEMNTLYDSPSTRSFDPLSDDEKEAMTDDQIEKWESKIKDSILRRDGTLGSLTSAMRTTLMGSVKVTGSDGIEKSYSLASFGIQTSVNYKEKGLLHIYGDKDDSEYADYTDKLMKAIEEDPDTVMKVLAGLTGDLYETMADKMSAIPNTRSAFTFYNDKEMDKIQTEYKKKVTLQEEKLVEMEDRYYKQFTAMETALAKMQSQQSALAGMLGQSTN